MLWFVAIVFVWFGDSANAFTCTESGLFANTDSNNCETFVSCDSNLNPTVNSCTGNTYFWPEKKGCYSQYNCATQSMPGNVDPCDGFTYNNIPDMNSADCTTYVSCGLNHVYSDGQYIQMPQVSIQQCPSGTAFRPGSGCTSYHRCVNYQCTTEGVFENPNDCSTFIRCWKAYGSSNIGMFSMLFPDLNNCSDNTKFNPLLKKCDAFYNCDQIDPYGGNDPCNDFNYANPFVPNPFDSSASSYLACQYSFNGFIGSSDIILKKECPSDALFSPLLGKCYNNYDPSETCSKDPCSSGPGKYVHYKSGHCNSFIECRDETKTSEVYEPTYEIRYCPDGTRYSPETSACNRQYTCPTFPVNYCYPQIPTTTTSTTTTSAPIP